MTWSRLTCTLILAAAIFAAGCGGDGDSAGGDSSRDADVEVLNDVLSRQLAAVEAYGPSVAALRGPAGDLAASFRAQEQEHAVAIVKALRGLGGESEADPEAIDAGDLRSRADHLAFLYELEGATIDLELSAISKLEETWPRALLGSIVANQAQHRLALRQLLGDLGPAAIPSAFENGTDPGPGEGPGAE